MMTDLADSQVGFDTPSNTCITIHQAAVMLGWVMFEQHPLQLPIYFGIPDLDKGLAYLRQTSYNTKGELSGWWCPVLLPKSANLCKKYEIKPEWSHIGITDFQQKRFSLVLFEN